jgi:hypothetical protein
MRYMMRRFYLEQKAENEVDAERDRATSEEVECGSRVFVFAAPEG